MSWQQILEIDPGESQPLRARIEALFAQQRATWPAMREGEAALSQLQRKTLSSGDETIVVQLNPSRRRSTLAVTDAKAIAARPCFLCPQNMPPEERGVAFEDLVVLPNPFPIVPLHCTIAAREHTPQQLAGRIATFLRLAEAIGPDMVALYNGPRCGASAPDHFHFQAASASDIPILAELAATGLKHSLTAHSSFGRNMLVFRSASASDAQSDLELTINGMSTESSEPMFNLLGHFQSGRHTDILFPRAAHRPACYFAEEPEKLSISPAVLEMCGLLIATEPDHFNRIDAATARSVYEEVSISSGR
jgi:hypothetical protein